jgi:hypothetical protein
MTFYYYDSKDNEFEYEVDWKDLETAVDKLLHEIAKVKSGENEAVERLLKFLLKDCDFELTEQIAEYLKDELQEHFDEEAQQQRVEYLQEL